MSASRIFTVLAAACLVVSFALATLIPPLMPLGQVLVDADHHLLTVMQAEISMHLSAWRSAPDPNDPARPSAAAATEGVLPQP